MDEIISGYRLLTGKAAMLPRWAYGFIQSQERYETQEEILDVAREFRDRGFGLDALVLDWCSWEDGMWGQKSFDPSRFPDPGAMMDALHQEDVHFMLSIWPNMSKSTADYEEFLEKSFCFLPVKSMTPLMRKPESFTGNRCRKGFSGMGWMPGGVIPASLLRRNGPGR